jgi:hypothetical protein
MFSSSFHDANRFCMGEQRFNARTLIRFPGIDSQVPAGFHVSTAKLVINQVFMRNEGAGCNIDAVECLMPFVDGDTYWTNYGDGGRDPGWLGEVMGQLFFSPQDSFDALTNSPGGAVSGINASGSIELEWDLDASIVQGWIDNPSNNNGLMLRIPIGCHISAWTAGGQNGPGDGGGNPPKLILEEAVAPAGPGFTSISISGGTATMEYTGESSTSYQLQKAALGSDSYVDEGSAQMTVGDGKTTFTDPSTGAGTEASYRAEQK